MGLRFDGVQTCVEWVLARLRERSNTLGRIHAGRHAEAAVGPALPLADPRSTVLCGGEPSTALERWESWQQSPPIVLQPLYS